MTSLADDRQLFKGIHLHHHLSVFLIHHFAIAVRNTSGRIIINVQPYTFRRASSSGRYTRHHPRHEAVTRQELVTRKPV